MNEEVVEVDDDSDIEVTFESAPVPKPLPPRFAFPPYHHPVRQVKRQRHSFNPKPCSFCRREFRDKVTVARHTVSHQITKRTFENKTPEICSHLVFFQVRHHWRAVREQNYGRDQKKKMSYYDLPDDREIRSELLEPESMSRGFRGFNSLPPIHHSPPPSPLRSSFMRAGGGVSPPRGAPIIQPLPPSGTGLSALERDTALLEARELLQHANSCLRRDREAALDGAPPTACEKPHCPSMKAVLEHIPTCTAGPACTFQHCIMAKGIIRMAKEEALKKGKKIVREEPQTKALATKVSGLDQESDAPTNGNGNGNGTTNGVLKKEARPKPKSQLEEYREKMEKERREREGQAKNEGGQANEAEGERNKTENGSHAASSIANGSTNQDGAQPIVIDEEPSGPVDVLSGILSSQAATQMIRKPLGPTTVETKEGRVEIPGKSFTNLQYRGVQYSVGDFVYVRSERGGEPEIHRLDRLFEREGIRTILGRRFYRAKMETFHEPTRIFYEKELARSSLNAIMPISRVLSRCYVMPVHHYNTHHAEGIAEKDTYVCEFNYFPKMRQWEKIEQGAYWKPPPGVKIVPREEPLGAKRMEEVQHAKRRANPINVQVSEKKSDVLSSILGDMQSASAPPPKKSKHFDGKDDLPLGLDGDATFGTLPSKPRVISEPLQPATVSASSSNLLSTVLASQSQLSVTGSESSPSTLPPKPRPAEPSTAVAPPPDRLSGLLASGLSVMPASNSLGPAPKTQPAESAKASVAPSDRLSGLLASGLSVKPAVEISGPPRATDEKQETTPSQPDRLSGLLASGISVKPTTEISNPPSKPRAPDPTKTPGPPPTDRLSGLLASGLSVTKRSVPVPAPGVTAQEAASYNSMFSL